MSDQMNLPLGKRYYVRSKGHGIIADGIRFLIVDERPGGWLLGWRDGVEPKHLGTALREELTEREQP